MQQDEVMLMFLAITVDCKVDVSRERVHIMISQIHQDKFSHELGSDGYSSLCSQSRDVIVVRNFNTS